MKNLIVEQLKYLLKDTSFSEIEAAILGGSLGREAGDLHSDVDVFILVEDKNLDLLLYKKIRELADSLGQVVLFRGPVPINNFGYSFSVLYSDKAVLQFNINSHSTLKSNYMNNQPFMVLIDKTGFYTNFLETSQEMINPDELFWRSFGFSWFRILSASKEVKRGNLWLALHLMIDIRNQIVIMERIIESKTHHQLNLNMPTKWIEKELSTDFNQFLFLINPEYSDHSIASSLISCINWILVTSERYSHISQRGYPQNTDFESIFAIADTLKNELLLL